jgi:hypothetical protein
MAHLPKSLRLFEFSVPLQPMPKMAFDKKRRFDDALLLL